MKKVLLLQLLPLLLLTSAGFLRSPAQTGGDVRVSRSPAGSSFLEARGGTLYYLDQPIKLKGFNLEVIGHDPDTIWRNYWDYRDSDLVPLVERAAGMGANTLRLIFPDDAVDQDEQGGVPDYELDKLEDMLALLRAHGVGAVVTVFNRHMCINRYPPAGDLYGRGEKQGGGEPCVPDHAKDANKISSFAARFGRDDRILMWDIVNEPQVGINQSIKLEWLRRMRQAFDDAAVAQLITIGADGQHELGINCDPGSCSTNSVIQMSDVVSFHCYGRWTDSIPGGGQTDGVDYRNPPDADGYCGGCIQYIRNRTPKPILLEEFGWPDAESNNWPTYHPWHIYDAFPRDADSMDQLYDELLRAVDRKGAVGAIQWTLQNTAHHHFGLLTADWEVKREGSPTSAYNDFRSWGGPTVRPITGRLPAAPTGLTAAPGCESVSFNWVASDRADGYWLDISPSPDFVTFQNRHVGAATGYTWAGLPTNTTYYWRVWAYNSYGGTHGYPDPRSVTTASCGPVYQGNHEVAGCRDIKGWAWDRGRPDAPVNVDIFDGGNRIATVAADGFRQDLLSAGIGNGYHAFSFDLPSNLRDGRQHLISVRFSATGGDLWNTPKAVSCGRYYDVPPDHPFYSYVECLSRAGVVGGYPDGNFYPGNTVTRAQFVKMVVLAMRFPLSSPPEPTFSDVGPDNDYYQYVETAAARGLIGGYQDGTFRPNANVTRGQMSKVIVLAGRQRWNWQINTNGGPHFPQDVPEGSLYYDYVETAYNLGLITGYDAGYFYPNSDATRGQASKIVSLGSRCAY